MFEHQACNECNLIYWIADLINFQQISRKKSIKKPASEHPESYEIYEVFMRTPCRLVSNMVGKSSSRFTGSADDPGFWHLLALIDQHNSLGRC